MAAKKVCDHEWRECGVGLARCDYCRALGRYGRTLSEPRVVVLTCVPAMGRCVRTATEVVKVGEKVVARCAAHARLG
jgi:hypothetical protein